MMEQLLRRAADTEAMKQQDDIDEMIKQEADPKQRVFLMVLQSMNRNLAANTLTTDKIAMQLDAHITEFAEHAVAEAALINRGRGAWKVLAVAASLVQGVIIAGMVHIGNELDLSRDSRVEEVVMHSTINHRLDELEARRK